ncbi:unnamed protein product [Echinostoma caproni]|uniref:NR LBD domain-containing protein n=1 Tax=Echinostoma caproni TaxID=27848 RepID=A0A183ATI9_9TREM|nr:unnamed protein product [Echinostoma caproni]
MILKACLPIDVSASQGVNSNSPNEKHNSLESSKPPDPILKQLTPPKYLDKTSRSASGITVDNPSVSSRTTGFVLLYEKMHEQHAYLMLEIDKISSIISLMNKLRPGSVSRTAVTTLEELLGSIQKFAASTYGHADAGNARERNSEPRVLPSHFDWSPIFQVVTELTDRLRRMRTALWSCVQLFEFNSSSNYAQAAHYLVELIARSQNSRYMNTNSIKSSHTPTSVNAVKPLKTAARSLMDFQSQFEGISFPPCAAATATVQKPIQNFHNNNNNNNNSNNNNTNNTRGLLLFPSTTGAGSFCWSQRNLHQSSARPICTQQAQYLPDPVVISETGLFTSDHIGTVQSPGFLFPHPTNHSAQPTLIMPSTLFAGSLNRNTALGPQLCSFQPGTRFPDRL